MTLLLLLQLGKYLIIINLPSKKLRQVSKEPDVHQYRKCVPVLRYILSRNQDEVQKSAILRSLGAIEKVVATKSENKLIYW